jgi:hypothetical protein
MRRFTGIILLFLFAFRLEGQQFYVSPAGNDLNPGTLLLPWQTVQHALNNSYSGCTIFLMSGSYAENLVVPYSGTSSAPIVLTNYNNQTAVISGTSSAGGALLHLNGKNWFTVTGLEFANYTMNDAQGILIEGNSDHVTVSGNKIHDIHFSQNVSDVPNANTNAQPLVVYGNDPAAAVTNLVIRENEIYNCRTGFSEALAVNGNVDGFTVEFNSIHDISNIGIDIIGHEGVCPNGANDQARNGMIRWNTVWNCVSPYATSGGIYVDGARDCVVQNNTSHHNGYGIEIGCENAGKTAAGIMVRSNIVYLNEEAGIIAGGYDFPANSGKVVSCAINSNTLYLNENSASFQGEIVVNYCEGLDVSNNLLYYPQPNPVFVRIEPGSTNLHFDYNIYYSTGAFEFYSANTSASFQSWQSATGLDSNSLFIDPLLVNPTALNFHLQSTSPALDAGDPFYTAASGESDMDTATRVQNGRVDIGADEYGTAVGITTSEINNGVRLLLNADHSVLEVRCDAQAKAIVISIITPEGKLVQQSILPAGTSVVYFNVGLLPSGIYLVSTSDTGGNGVRFLK